MQIVTKRELRWLHNPDRVDFKFRKVARDNEDSIYGQKSIQQENTAIVNIYAPKNIAPKHKKQTLMELRDKWFHNNSWRL